MREQGEIVSTLTVDVADVPARFEELVIAAERGIEVVVQRNGEGPRARFVVDAVPEPRKKRIAGLHEGRGWMTDDFDAPLPDSFWLGEE